MNKIIIIEPNPNNKDQVKAYLVKGEKGYSAYDLYVQNGGTLTEEEWLDAFLTAENYYTKTEVDGLKALLTGTFDVQAATDGVLEIADYPTGYTKDNCCVVSFMKKDGDTWYTITNESSNDVMGVLPSVQLLASKVAISDITAFDNGTSYQYKIVLMKIS